MAVWHTSWAGEEKDSEVTATFQVYRSITNRIRHVPSLMSLGPFPAKSRAEWTNRKLYREMGGEAKQRGGFPLRRTHLKDNDNMRSVLIPKSDS